MDPTSPCTGPAVPHYVQLPTTHGGSRGCMVVHKRFEKSESEDSGVELPPASPFGSESSYNLDESESLESSTPEYSESLDSPTAEDPGSPKKTTIENQDSLAQLEETLLLEQSARKKSGSFKMHPDNDIDAMECFFTQQRERDVSGVPHKLEQAILRSRRQRSTSRESIQSRTTRYSRQSVGSLKDQRRGKAFSYQTRSPTRQCQENKDQDPLILPGDGLRYLESLCQMLEQIAELQQKNQRLQQEKREAEGRRNNQVLFLDACVCGASRDSRDMDNDLTDNPRPKERTWEPTHYRKRSSSHAGMLLSMARPTDNGMREAHKIAPQYVSVPNLQEEKAQRLQRNCKAEASQWYKVKDMLSRLAGRGAGPLHGGRQTVEPPTSCRTQTLLEGNPQHPKRLFLPGLVIRPRNHGRQLH
ncbi:uncharacterized protein C8orf58 homolog [Bufo gargarizans]|uniref:uncharacterized protein C8orf58 homolog n=1 Tax=Bufo gargarizans TaxID=30331 RepID=UPI001CF2F288|nr:uncharacterized protein C8orf58 homolog [Bufo gargarizans]